jgi:Chitobiase/beta-hexosaminidase C-terminal domain
MKRLANAHAQDRTEVILDDLVPWLPIPRSFRSFPMFRQFARHHTGFRHTFSFLLILAVAISCGLRGHAQTTPTNVQINGTVLQSSVHRLGVNLGDQNYWDSGQMMKNLIFENPGFEGLKYRVIFHCGAVTANTCLDDNQYNGQAANYWKGGTYLVISGNSAGATGSVVSNTAASTCSGCGPTITFDKNINLAVGDYFSVVASTPGSGDAGWADTTSGGATITTETTDLSPETPGKQAMLMSANGSGQLAALASGFDTWTNLSFIQMNGAFQVTFRAKGVGGSNVLNVNLRRLQAGLGSYLYSNVTLTNSWQDYTLTFSVAETGSAVGPMQLMFTATGASVELDDVSLIQTNSSSSNPTAFRDDVVNALKDLNPGTIRMMAAGAALGSDLPNQLQVPFARYREGFNADGNTYPDIPYGIHEFLQLCQTVGADPWITIPTATTPSEMTDFIQYLTGTGSDSWSALRISRGQSAPWTSVFNKIHIELGNETWNGYFKGESMNYPQYPVWANQIFGTARQTSGFQASKFDLILSGLAASPGYNQPMLSSSTQHDSFDIAPYLLFDANNEAQSTMFGAMFAEPEIFDSPGGEVNQNVQLGVATPSATSASTYVSVYETNLGTMGGTITQAQLNVLTPSIGAGIAHADHMLQMMRSGIQYQNTFALPQFEYRRSDGSMVPMWGIVVDMGTTNRRRPQFLTQSMANAVIGGTMIQTVQSGANPTWNQPLSSDNVQLNGAHYLQSFAFQNGTKTSAVLFNVSQTTALPVTFSGENTPAGSVQMTQITSANITDNNETSQLVAPTTQTLSGFSGSTGLSLPPYSMTVLTWTSTFAQAPNFSVAPGTYSTTQTVALSSVTSGATIYYTTNGSTPTTSSTKYSGPITVSQTQTLSAIAVATNLSSSAVSTALYTIQPVAASPVFSPGTGIFNAGQSVTITDAVAGAKIYYTTNGTTPTTASAVYTGPISVTANETLTAIAGAANYTNSAASSAVYTIAPPTTAPTFDVAAGTYPKTQYLQISDAQSGAAIFFTTDGSTPTASSPRYSAGVTLAVSQTVKAMALAPTYSASPVVAVTYVIAPYAATPAISVPGGTYRSPQTVTLTDTTPGAAIHYTVDQTTPTASSPLYTGPITVNQCEYLQVIAVATGYTQSFATTANYIMNVGTPTFGLAAGTYSGTQTVAISDVTPGASIFYTVDGSTPYAGSTKYTGPITIKASETLKAIASYTNYTAGLVGSASYVITSSAAAAMPTFSVAAGTYTSAQTVAISDSTSGAKIYYTTNGTTPTTSSSVYSAPLAVSASETLEAIAVASGYGNSAVSSAIYTISTTAAMPAFSVASGTYASAQTVTMSDSTPNAKIYYTTNGTAPTTSSSVYSAPITVGATETLQAIAAATGYTSSAVKSAVITINLAALAPTFSIGSGSYTSAQTVTISTLTPLATIYYTTNGTTPTSSSSVYSGPITVSSSETVEAVAIALSLVASPVSSATYTINSANPINFPSGFAAKSLSLNGYAALSGTALQLTNGGASEAASAWFPTAVAVSTFTSDFDVQLPSSTADGFTFAIQNSSKGANALGGNGGALGYQYITNSVAIAFDLYQSGVTNAETLSLYINDTQQAGVVNLATTAINLHNGDVFHVHIVNNGTSLSVIITDKTTAATATASFAVNVASSVGSTTAYAGFTGSTGGMTAVQNILDWTMN